MNKYNESTEVPLDVQIIQKRWTIKNLCDQRDAKKRDINNLEREIDNETKMLKEMEQELKNLK